MSEQVHYKGKIELVERLDETLEEQCKRILMEYNVDLTDIDDYINEFYEYFGDEYVISDNSLYKVISIEEVTDEDVFSIHDNKDGTYDYEVSYYNGGCSFDEAINIGFKEKGMK